MKYVEIWRIVLFIDLAGILIMAGGIVKGGILGVCLATLGVSVIVGATLRVVWEGAIVGLVLGGLTGYLIFSGIKGGYFGLPLGGLFGAIVSGGMGWWSNNKKKEIDKTLSSAEKKMSRHKNATHKKMNALGSIMKLQGQYIMNSKTYRRELKYISERIEGIRYKNNDPKSLDNAASSYMEIRGELDRLGLHISRGLKISGNREVSKGRRNVKGLYANAPESSLDPDKYSEVFGQRSEDGKLIIPDRFKKKKRIRRSGNYQKALAMRRGQRAPLGMRKTLRRYEMDEHLTSGIFADVYYGKAADGRDVVIKILPKNKLENKDISTLADFMTGTREWRELEHPNIVSIFDSDVRPTPHIAMEKMEGGDLDSLMKNRKLTVEEAVQIMCQLMKGVIYAHAKPALHCDIKPKNILFNRDGTAKISDWGWNKFLAIGNPKKFKERKVRLAYSSPEQIDPDRFGKVDEATDLFQLGIIFYEMLTGKNPFYIDDPIKVQINITEKEPDPPSKENMYVPEELDIIVMKALEKKKENRWKSVEEMYEILIEVVEPDE